MTFKNLKGKLMKQKRGIVVLSGRPRQHVRGLPWRLRRLFREDAPRHNFCEQDDDDKIVVKHIRTRIDGDTTSYIYKVDDESDEEEE